MTAPGPLTADEVRALREVAEVAEAAVARVGALADEWQAEDVRDADVTYGSAADELRAALGGIDDGEGSR